MAEQNSPEQTTKRSDFWKAVNGMQPRPQNMRHSVHMSREAILQYLQKRAERRRQNTKLG